MHDEAEIGLIGRNLVYAGSPLEQREALQALWLNGSAEALKLMTQALKSPRVKIKDEILGFLSFRDLALVYRTLITVLEEADEAVKQEILDCIDRLDLKVRYIDKVKQLREDPSRYDLLVVMIKFLGKLQDRELMDELGHLIDVDDDQIRLALMDALELAEAGKCPDYIFDSMQLFSPTVSGRALDLIAELQDTSSVPALLSMLTDGDDSTRAKIFSVLDQFEYSSLVQAVKGNLVESGGVPDQKMFRGWVMYLRKIGKDSVATIILENFDLEPEPAGDKAAKSADPEKMLAFEVSSIDGTVVLGLNGKLIIHSLPGFKRTLTFIIKNGYTRVVLKCDYLLGIDHHAAAFLETTDRRLRRELGGITYSQFHALNEFQRSTLMPSAEFYSDVSSAIDSFTEKDLPSVIQVDSSMFSPGTLVDVAFTAGKHDRHRACTVLDVEEKKISLSWEVLDDSHIFTDFVNDKVNFGFERDRDRFEARTKVINQDPSLEPHIKLLLPRIAKLMDRRRQARVDCRLLMIFQKIDDERTVSDTEYPGVCLKISETGLVIMTPLPMFDGSMLLVRVNPADLTVGKIMCQVQKVTEYVQQKKRFFEYHLNYVKIRDYDRSTIKSFVYGRLVEDI